MGIFEVAGPVSEPGEISGKVDVVAVEDTQLVQQLVAARVEPVDLAAPGSGGVGDHERVGVMSLVLLTALVAGTVLAVTAAKGRVNVPAGRTGDDEAAHRSAPFGRESEQARSTPPGTPGGNGQTSMEPGNRALMVLGLGVLAVSLIMPFARNEAGCLDHCYDARDWYWWVPTHNLGAPLLLIGVAGASMRLRSRPTRWAPVRLSALCGWVGAAFTCLVAPSWIDEFLYGGPEAEILPALWLAPAGWALLWAGTVRLPRAVARMPGLNWRGDRHRDGLTTA